MNYKKLLSIILLGIMVAGMASVSFFNNFLADRPLAYIRKFRPKVSILSVKNTEVNRGAPLYAGDSLFTGQHGLALVQFMDKSIVKVQPNSVLIVQGKVEGKDNVTIRILLEAGDIFSNVTKRPTNNFEVATNTAVASVKGTQFGATSEGYFWVGEGVVTLTSLKTGETDTLFQQMYGIVNKNGEIETGKLTDEELQKRYEKYRDLEEKLSSEVIKLIFKNKQGQTKKIEVDYFNNEEQN